MSGLWWMYLAVLIANIVVFGFSLYNYLNYPSLGRLPSLGITVFVIGFLYAGVAVGV